LVSALLGGARLAGPAQFVSRLAAQRLIDQFDGQSETSGQFGGEGVDLVATFRTFAFDRQWVTQDELGRPEAGDFPSDLGEAFLGLGGYRRREREGEA
jgi:hypothetical protein